MNDEDFKRTVLDYFEMVEPQRYREIMANLTDVQANNKAILAALTEHIANTKTVLAELAATGATGHAAIMEGLALDQAEILAAVKTGDAEITAAGKAIQLPGVAPAAPPA